MFILPYSFRRETVHHGGKGTAAGARGQPTEETEESYFINSHRKDR